MQTALLNGFKLSGTIEPATSTVPKICEGCVIPLDHRPLELNYSKKLKNTTLLNV